MKYKFIPTLAKKDKTCYACTSPIQAGENIVIMQEILDYRKFEMLCPPCGESVSRQQLLSKPEIRAEGVSLREKLDTIIQYLSDIRNEL